MLATPQIVTSQPYAAAAAAAGAYPAGAARYAIPAAAVATPVTYTAAAGWVPFALFISSENF